MLSKIFAIALLLTLAVCSAEHETAVTKPHGAWETITHKLTGWFHSSPKHDELDEIVDVYTKAGERARDRLAALQVREGDPLDQSIKHIANVYDKAAQEAEEHVRDLRAKAGRLHAEASEAEKAQPSAAHERLDEAAAQVRGLFNEGVRRAQEQVQHLQKRSDESWDAFKRRVADVYDSNARAVQNQIKQIRNGAARAAQATKEAVIDTPREKVGEAFESAKGTVSSIAGAGVQSYEDTRSKIANIWRNAMSKAAESARAVKASGAQSLEDAQARVAQIYRDAVATAEQQVNAVYSSAESAKDKIGSAYDHAASTAHHLSSKAAESVRSLYPSQSHADHAKEQLMALTERAGESFDALKKRIGAVYQNIENDDDKHIAELQAQIEEAERRKAAHQQAKEQVEALPEIAGESFQDKKRRIVDIYDKAEAPGLLAHTWRVVKDKVSSVFSKEEPKPKSVADYYREAADSAKAKLAQLSSSTDDTYQNAKNKIAKVYQDAIDGVEAQMAEMRQKTASMLGVDEDKRQQLAESYRQAAINAKDKVAQLVQSPDESYEATKQKIGEIYDKVFNLEPSSAVGQTWQSVKNAASDLWQTTKEAMKTDVPSTYRHAVTVAHNKLNNLPALMGESWSNQRHRVAQIYREALVDAEGRLFAIEKRVVEAEAHGKEPDPNDAVQFRMLQIYKQTLNPAVDVADSIKHVSGDTFDDTKRRVAQMFHDYVDNLESQAEEIAHPKPTFFERVKGVVAGAAHKIGLAKAPRTGEL